MAGKVKQIEVGMESLSLWFQLPTYLLLSPLVFLSWLCVTISMKLNKAIFFETPRGANWEEKEKKAEEEKVREARVSHGRSNCNIKTTVL